MKKFNILKYSLGFASILFVSSTIAQQSMLKTGKTIPVRSMHTNTLHLAHANTEENTNKPMGKSKHRFADSMITAKVKEKFIQEKLFGKEKVPAMKIHVKTINGIVYLSGKAPTQKQADNAVSIAKSTKGVKQVVTRIKVKKGSMK